MSAMQNETLEQQTNGQHDDFEAFVGNASQNQVMEKIIDDKIKRAVENAVLTVENCMHDAILTAMCKVVFTRVEKAVRSVTGSSRLEPKREVQNPDRRVFFGNAGNTPLMSASSRLDLNTNQERADETRNEENFEDGDFPVLKPNYDRRAHTHHNV